MKRRARGKNHHFDIFCGATDCQLCSDSSLATRFTQRMIQTTCQLNCGTNQKVRNWYHVNIQPHVRDMILFIFVYGLQSKNRLFCLRSRVIQSTYTHTRLFYIVGCRVYPPNNVHAFDFFLPAKCLRKYRQNEVIVEGSRANVTANVKATVTVNKMNLVTVRLIVTVARIMLCCVLEQEGTQK